MAAASAALVPAMAAVAAPAAARPATPRARPAAAVADKVVVAAAHVTAHPRHQHAAGAHAQRAMAAIATMTHNPPAPMRTWAPTWVTAIQAIAARAMVRAVSPTPCAPAWTAWLNAVAVVVAVGIATLEGVAMAADQARVAVVAGATGLVGQAVLAALLTAESRKAPSAPAAGAPQTSGTTVHVLHAKGRRAPALSHPRLQLHAVDFAAMPTLPPVDDVYITLGTTMAAAGSQSAFRVVDYDAVMATAHAARAAGATRCGVVTAMGANAQSRIFYNRVKGEVERDLQQLGFETLVIAPSQRLDHLAAKHDNALPRSVRLLLRGIGAMNKAGGALTSYLLFEQPYTRALIDLGYRDTEARKGEVRAFLGI